jgi:hypothetical protein
MFRVHLFRPRRFALLVALVVTAGLLTAATAYGLTAGVTPDSQSVCSGCTATWGGSWLGQSPYDVTFHYGDGSTPWTYSGSATSHGWNHQFYTCTGQTYQQHLHVGDHTGATADIYVSTSVARGDICAPTN